MNSNILQDMYYHHNNINGIDIHTIGCELSEWDGERIASLINNKLDNILLINTCAVTDRAQKASEMITERLTKIYPEKKTFITGCGVNYKPDYYKKYGTCLINEDKFDCKHYNVSNKLDINFNHNDDIGFVKVQDGCANNCSYCIVNKLRSKPYSLPYSDIYNQIKNYLDYNVTHIEIIGTEITQYHSDDMFISDLCSRILNDFSGITSLTLNALDPASLQIEKLADIMLNDSRMTKLLYMSVQSGSNKILQSMNRHYTRERILEIFKKYPTIEQNWDLVVGFPGETEEDFQLTYDLVKTVMPTELMMCPYSKRDGALASTMDNQINYELKIERMDKLRHIICNVEEMEKPNIDKNRNHFTLDLYNTDEVCNFYKYLDKTKDLVICDVYYDDRLDNDIFEVNNKLLSVNFDTLYNIKIKNNYPKYINDFCDYYNGDIV